MNKIHAKLYIKNKDSKDDETIMIGVDSHQELQKFIEEEKEIRNCDEMYVEILKDDTTFMPVWVYVMAIVICALFLFLTIIKWGEVIISSCNTQ